MRANQDAKDFLSENYFDEIVEQLLNEGEVSDDIYNDYPNGDGLFHEEIIDKEYSPKEAISILEEYDDYEETDSGLWEGVNDWRRILSTIAAFTYGNAVHAELRDLFEEINALDVDEIRDRVSEEIEAEHAELPLEDEELEKETEDGVKEAVEEALRAIIG